MENEKIIEILENEMACVTRAETNKCDRNCGKCDLVRPANEILQAMGYAINAVIAMDEISKITTIH